MGCCILSSKCRFCENYLTKLDRCKFCHFEKDKDYNPFVKDNWDIMSLNAEDGWEHKQIIDRLHSQGIDCYSADIWFDNNMAFLMGVDPSKRDKVARVLKLHNEVIYVDGEHQFMILNLYQEKDLRKEQKSCESCKYFIDSMFGDCQLGNLEDENIINENGVMRVNCKEWERKE